MMNEVLALCTICLQYVLNIFIIMYRKFPSQMHAYKYMRVIIQWMCYNKNVVLYMNNFSFDRLFILVCFMTLFWVYKCVYITTLYIYGMAWNLWMFIYSWFGILCIYLSLNLLMRWLVHFRFRASLNLLWNVSNTPERRQNFTITS